MTILSKTTAGLSLFSCVRDIHKTAMTYSKNAAAKNASDTFIASSIGSQKTNYNSAKDAQRKKWLFLNNEFAVGASEICGNISGYIKGAKQGITRYLPNFAIGAYALLAQNSTRANFAALALGIIEALDFVKNSTNLFERRDYLK